MEDYIKISNLNDFIFCPRSIYFHNLYSDFDESTFHSSDQEEGRNAHETINENKYSSKKSFLQSIEVYSEELEVAGKIDLLDVDEKKLIERKKHLKKLYYGHYLQIFAQYFCLIEMGYEVKSLCFRSLSDNKVFEVNLPTKEDKEKLKKVILEMKNFDLEDPNFSQNPNKCKKCIYRHLCDYYKNDE